MQIKDLKLYDIFYRICDDLTIAKYENYCMHFQYKNGEVNGGYILAFTPGSIVGPIEFNEIDETVYKSLKEAQAALKTIKENQVKLQDLKVLDTFYKICGKIVKRYKVYSTEVNYDVESGVNHPIGVYIRAYDPNLAHICETFTLNDDPIYKSLEEAQAQIALKTIEENKMRFDDLDSGEYFKFLDEGRSADVLIKTRCGQRGVSLVDGYVYHPYGEEVVVYEVEISSSKKVTLFKYLSPGDKFTIPEHEEFSKEVKIKASIRNQVCYGLMKRPVNYLALDGDNAGILFFLHADQEVIKINKDAVSGV